MEHVAHHRLIDLTIADDDASEKLKARRQFMSRMGMAAFAASATPAAFAQALARLATDPQLRANLGQGAAAYAREHFEASRVGTQIESLYESVIAARSRHA